MTHPANRTLRLPDGRPEWHPSHGLVRLGVWSIQLQNMLYLVMCAFSWYALYFILHGEFALGARDAAGNLWAATLFASTFLFVMPAVLIALDIDWKRVTRLRVAVIIWRTARPSIFLFVLSGAWAVAFKRLAGGWLTGLATGLTVILFMLVRSSWKSWRAVESFGTRDKRHPSPQTKSAPADQIESLRQRVGCEWDVPGAINEVQIALAYAEDARKSGRLQRAAGAVVMGISGSLMVTALVWYFREVSGTNLGVAVVGVLPLSIFAAAAHISSDARQYELLEQEYRDQARQLGRGWL